MPQPMPTLNMLVSLVSMEEQLLHNLCSHYTLDMFVPMEEQLPHNLHNHYCS